MREQKQKYRHDLAIGHVGDCFRTSIACVLNVDRDSVPHFFEAVWNNDRSALMAHEHLNRWLTEEGHGLHFIEFPVDSPSLAYFKDYLENYFKDLYVLVGCNSKNGGHSVVMRGNHYMWDPSIDNSGCVGPMDDGYYWIGLLVHRRDFG